LVASARGDDFESNLMQNQFNLKEQEIFRNFAIKDGELTPKQKRKMVFLFVSLTYFVTLHAVILN
jgi:hypothetical protein